jgi:rod shape-determining protein MreD
MMATADEQRPGIRPRPTVGRRLDVTARHAFPASCTILLMLLTQAPFGISGQAALLPAVTFASVWFWSLFRPTAMPPPVVFMIGLLFDLLGWLPIGVGVLTLLMAHGLAQRWRRPLAPHGFALVWFAFACVAVAASSLDWALGMLLTWRLLPPGPAVFQAVLAAAAYPALAILFAGAHRSIANPERA